MNEFCYSNIPSGMNLSVKRDVTSQKLHRVRDVSISGCKRDSLSFFSTERCIPDGMQTLFLIIYFACLKLFLLTAFFSSCTELIDIKPSNSEPVIVIYGYLTEDNVHQTIRISVSSPYFEMQPNQPVSNAIVSIQSSDNQTFELVETAENGLYCTRFPMAAVIGTTYHLSVQADINQSGNLKLYEATTTMPRAFQIDTVEIKTMTIMGFKHYNLYLYAQELPGNHYYYARAIINDTLMNSRISRAIVFSDYGIDGQYLDGFPLMQFEDSENNFFQGREDQLRYHFVKPGDKITFCISLIEKGFHDFLEQAQRERRGENPFFGGPASNITTNISNGGVGYFTSFCTTRMDVYVP